MGWVWKDEPDASVGSGDNGITNFQNPNPRSEDRCSTRRIVKSQCRTEEVEPGKFVRKCEKTEEILKECVGRPVEVVQSNKEYTEDDVTDQVVKGSFPFGKSEVGPFEFPGLRSDMEAIGPFEFPGLRSDIEAIERSLFSSLGRFFESAEEMKNGFFGVFGAPNLYDRKSSSSSTTGRGIPIEGRDSQEEASPKPNVSDSGNIDLAGLARDV